jgi:uncharacterized membrane protein
MSPRFKKLYLLSLIPFLALDFFWLGWVAPTFYQSQIGHLMAENVGFIAAGLFYLLFVGGLVHFVIEPSSTTTDLKDVLRRGAFFGLVTYATYDLTNLATLRDWPILLSLVDMAWGATLSGLTSAASVWASRKLNL